MSFSAAENPTPDALPARRRKSSAAQPPTPSESPQRAPLEASPVAAADDDRAWHKFAQRLAERPAQRFARRLRAAAAGELVLLWGVPESPPFDAARALVRRLDKAHRQGVSKSAAPRLRTLASEWLAHEPLTADRPAWLLEALAWAYAAPQLASPFGPALWEQLVDKLGSLARDAAGLPIEQDPWTHQLLSELGITLAQELAELPACAALAEPARHALALGLTELTDGEGLLHARYMHLARPLLACWTRAQLAAGKDVLSREARDHYVWFVEQAIRWTHRSGAELLASFPVAPWQPALFATALELADHSSSWFLAATLLPRDAAWSARGHRALKKKHRPTVSHTSEWAEAAILRSDWSRRSPQLAVKFPDRTLSLQLDAGQRTLLSGTCLPEIKVDGRPLAFVDEWELTCQFSDADAEYAELQGELEGGWRVQRQMFLGRTDGFLLLADAVLGPNSARIDYATHFPLGPHTTFQPAEETHEGWLKNKDKTMALVLPIGLPEWRSDRPLGVLRANDTHLVLEQYCQGRALFCPLFLDLDRRRRKSEHTWRHLTVGANRTVQPADVAVGYRVQIGKRQWLVYRSLTPRTGRSVLGQHFIHEFVLGRFTRRGLLDELIQIE